MKEISGLNPHEFGGRRLHKAIHSHEQVEVVREDEWRISYLHSLLSQRLESRYRGDEEEEKRLTKLIDSLTL